MNKSLERKINARKILKGILLCDTSASLVTQVRHSFSDNEAARLRAEAAHAAILDLEDHLRGMEREAERK